MTHIFDQGQLVAVEVDGRPWSGSVPSELAKKTDDDRWVLDRAEIVFRWLKAQQRERSPSANGLSSL